MVTEAVRKCGVHSVNMATVKACFAMQNLKLEFGVPTGLFSPSIKENVCRMTHVVR